MDGGKGEVVTRVTVSFTAPTASALIPGTDYTTVKSALIRPIIVSTGNEGGVADIPGPGAVTTV